MYYLRMLLWILINLDRKSVLSERYYFMRLDIKVILLKDIRVVRILEDL